MTAWRPGWTRSRGRAQRRGGPEAVSAAWERAAGLTTDAGTRARRLHNAAMSAWLGGQTGRAHLLAEDARRYASDPVLRSAIDRLRARLQWNVGSAPTGQSIVPGDAPPQAAPASPPSNAYGDQRMLEVIARGLGLGHVEYYLTKPWRPRQHLLYPVVGEALVAWTRANWPGFEPVRIVGDSWHPLSHELRDMLSATTSRTGLRPGDCPVLPALPARPVRPGHGRRRPC
jgi:hypothetical protein